MTSVQRFFANDRNLVADAADLTASSVATSTVVRTATVDRAGNGRVRLTGDYSGHEDTIIDVAIASGGATLRASSPVQTGVGNGALTVTGVTAPAVAETWTLTLVDLGTDTTHASLQVDSVVLRAIAAGVAGNDVRLTVTPVYTTAASDYSLITDWPAGTETMAGAEFDFGGLPLSAKGELDAASPRLVVGTDYTIYRPYRSYVDGAWRYGMTPPPPRTLPAGAKVRSVSGGYDVVVTDGTTTETYAGVVTFYDLLAALAGSALVEVVGVVVADRTPGGMAMRDVPLRTSSWVLNTTGVDLDGIAPSATQPTERITVECINNDAVGSEVWSVTGTVSGELGTAVSGDAFTSDAISFTVPDLSASVSGTGEWTTAYIPATRADGEETPSVGVVDFTLGINAAPGTYTFTLEDIPDVTGCDYTQVSIDGRITAACLGLLDTGGDAMDTTLKTKLTALHSWHSDFLEAVTVFGAQSLISTQKITLAARIVGIFSSAMQEIYAEPAAVTQWDTELTDMKKDMEVFDSAYGGATATSLTFPYTGNLSGGTSYTISGAQYVLTRIVVTSGGEVQASCAVSAMAAPSLSSTTDGAQTVVAGVYTLTFVRREVSLKDSVVNDGETNSSTTAIDVEIAGLVAKYEAAMDHCRVLADIVPKSDASSAYGAGDGCWRESPDATQRWVCDGYLPAFSNVAYISSKTSCGSGASAGVPTGNPYSTMEFGFAIAVGCADRLKIGDKVVIVIGSVDGSRPYSVGSKATIDVVTAGPAWLAGGIDGDDTQVWSVVGSVSGAHPDYDVPTDGSAIPAYTDDGVTMQMASGGIGAALGDSFTFAVEAGQFAWRRDGGSWSSAIDIDDEVALADGLSAQFLPGAAPSFVPDDAWTFAVEQPNAPSHIADPDIEYWSWSGASATLVVDLGGAQDIDAVAIARYSMPAGATVTVQGGDGSTWPNSVTLDVSGQVAAAMLAATWNVTHLRLSVSSAADGRIGWLWAGVPLATGLSATTCRISRVYGITRGAGYNPSSMYAGRGSGGEVAWDGGWLTQTDLTELLAMLDHLQAGGEPLILVPNAANAEDAALVRVDIDSVEIDDVHAFTPTDPNHRRISMRLPLTAVIQ